MALLVDIDEAPAGDPNLAGAKAAALARARRARLPALPGVVVPVAASRAAVATATAALERGGSGAARLAAMGVELHGELLEALRDQLFRLGPPVVVRSSSPLEGGGLWAGAFSSFADVGAAELSTAVRGVWASAFSVHALELCAAAGTDPAGIGLAVLVQPQVRPVSGGSARAAADGTVEVRATLGSPHDLMGGWESGHRAVVHADGRVDDPAVAEALGGEVLRAAAALARRVRATLGDDLVEWAWTAAGIVLLQASRLPAPAPPPEASTVGPRGGPTTTLDHRLAPRIAHLVTRFPGALGERLVLPWALSLPAPPAEAISVTPAADPLADLELAAALATDLAKEAWQERSERSQPDAPLVCAALRGNDPGAALDRVAALRPVDRARGSRVVALVEGVAGALAARGVLDDPRRLWAASLDEARALAAGTRRSPPRQRPAPDRWEPFVHGAVRAHGRAAPGAGVVDGTGAGRAVAVTDPHASPPGGDRYVLVAQRPLSALAPLLWGASGLVTATGNPAAHLVEVATSLGVPTVLAADLSAIGGPAGLASGRVLAAVDGVAGLAAFLAEPPAGTGRDRPVVGYKKEEP